MSGLRIWHSLRVINFKKETLSKGSEEMKRIENFPVLLNKTFDNLWFLSYFLWIILMVLKNLTNFPDFFCIAGCVFQCGTIKLSLLLRETPVGWQNKKKQRAVVAEVLTQGGTRVDQPTHGSFFLRIHFNVKNTNL